ncbi:MAG: type I 3-dehydroquinate dehydratase [Acidobacteriota bacterium]
MISDTIGGSRATLVATLAHRAATSPEALRTVAEQADWLEVRGDLVGDLSPADLPGDRLLYTVRSRAEGGRGETDPEDRRQRFAAALEAGYGLIDLEAERDLEAETLALVPAERRLLSWHGRPRDLADLTRRFEAMATTPARFYKLVPTVHRPAEGLWPLQLLASLQRADVIAFGGGPQGLWTRLLAPRLGAAWIYGAASEEASGAPGQPTVAALRRDFGLPELAPVEALCGVVGRPVAHSLSPRLHNGGYRALGLPLLYLPFETERFGDFWLEIVESRIPQSLGAPLRGLSVTAPFKGAALAVSGAASPLCERLGVANTLVFSAGVWEAESTDPVGIVYALRSHGCELEGRPAAVVGTGGAGRAAAFGLAREGARVTLFNRGAERAREAAEALDLPWAPLGDLDEGRFEVLVHATSAGRRRDDPAPLDASRLAPGAAVVDMVYGQEPTALLEAVAAEGGIAIDGREVLLYQALDQFRAMTGRDLPLDLGRELLGLTSDPVGAGPADAGELGG